MDSGVLLTRNDLRQRWSVGLRMVDRLRKSGKLPWIDVSGGRGSRPTVRFRLHDIETFEAAMRSGNADAGVPANGE